MVCNHSEAQDQSAAGKHSGHYGRVQIKQEDGSRFHNNEEQEEDGESHGSIRCC